MSLNEHCLYTSPIIDHSSHNSRATEPQRPGRPWPPHFLGQFFLFFKPAGDLSEAQRSLLSEFDVLASLILVMPATNAVSERSFSALRRIKTYLRDPDKAEQHPDGSYSSRHHRSAEPYQRWQGFRAGIGTPSVSIWSLPFYRL